LDRKDNLTFTPREHPNFYWSEVLTGVLSDWELIEPIEMEIASTRRYWIGRFISFSWRKRKGAKKKTVKKQKVNFLTFLIVRVRPA
jgi:hypothetical protein